MGQMGSIYVLHDPLTGEVRYVGQTVRDIRRRFAGHLHDARNDKGSACARWVSSLLASGFLPNILVWERTVAAELNTRERFWIAAFRENGHRLTNLAEGGAYGRRGYSCSPAVRAKISAAHTGRKLTSEHKAAISAGLAGRTVSSETRSRISTALQGTTRSPEHCEAMGAARRGVPLPPRTPEQRLAQSVRMRGQRSELGTQAIWEIKELLATTNLPQKRIGEMYGLHPTTVSNIKTGKSWSHVTFPPTLERVV